MGHLQRHVLVLDWNSFQTVYSTKYIEYIYFFSLCVNLCWIKTAVLPQLKAWFGQNNKNNTVFYIHSGFFFFFFPSGAALPLQNQCSWIKICTCLKMTIHYAHKKVAMVSEPYHINMHIFLGLNSWLVTVAVCLLKRPLQTMKVFFLLSSQE